MTGERQQRLLRELETLALEHGQGARIGVEEVEAAAAPSAERQVWGLVDALVAGDGQGATRAFLELRAQGETLPAAGAAHGPPRARRARDRDAAGGGGVARAGQGLAADAAHGPPIGASRRRGRPTPRRCGARSRRWPTLEVASRGQSELADDTEALRAIAAIAA